MKSAKDTHTRKKGFTLVEIIITLVAAGILGTIFISLMSTALSDSWQSVEMVNNETRVVRKMEEITRDYVKAINSVSPGAMLTILLPMPPGQFRYISIA